MRATKFPQVQKTIAFVVHENITLSILKTYLYFHFLYLPFWIYTFNFSFPLKIVWQNQRLCRIIIADRWAWSLVLLVGGICFDKLLTKFIYLFLCSFFLLTVPFPLFDIPILRLSIDGFFIFLNPMSHNGHILFRKRPTVFLFGQILLICIQNL